MFNFLLKVKDNVIYRFEAAPTAPGPHLLHLPPDVPCQQMACDRALVEVICKNESLKYSSIEFTANAEFSSSLAQILAQVAEEDARFVYVDRPNSLRYLLHFDSGFTSSSSTTLFKLVRMPVSQNEEASLEKLDKKIADLEAQLASKNDFIAAQLTKLEKMKSDTEEHQRIEAKHNMETDILYKRIKEIREKLASNNQIEEALKEKLSEKEKLNRSLLNLNREQAIKRKELLDKMSKKYEDLRTELLNDAEQKIQQGTDREKKLKATLKLSMQKQAYLDSVSSPGWPDNDLRKTAKEKEEEYLRLKNILETREKKKTSLNNSFTENRDYIEIGLCKLCGKVLANIVNFPCHHFGEVCEACNNKKSIDDRCIKCWNSVEYYEVIKTK